MAHSENNKAEFKISEISQEVINEYDINGPFNTLLKIRAKQQQTNLIVNFADLNRKVIQLKSYPAKNETETLLHLTSEETDLEAFCNTLPEGVSICAHELSEQRKSKKCAHQFLFINRIDNEAELFFIKCDEFTPQKNIIDFCKKKSETQQNNNKKIILEPKTTTIDSALWLALSIEHIKAASLIEKQTVNI